MLAAAADVRAIPWPEAQPSPEELRREALWPHPRRIIVAMALAKDLDTCRALMLGEPVRPSALNQDALRAARRRRLVRLDVREIDLLIPGALDEIYAVA